MSRLLAIDTSGDACSAALWCDGVVTEQFALTPRDHTRLILPMVDTLLGQAGMALRQLDAIAFGRGPGSFTGLRISAGVVQGLAFGAGLPVVPVSSLAAVAQPALRAHPGARALVCMDARMGEAYFAAYEWHGAARLLGAELLAPLADVPVAQCMAADRVLLALGSGWPLLTRDPALAAAAFAVMEPAALPRAAAIAELAAAAWRRGESVPAHQVEPAYLREQVAWQKGG
jgi:tRNA threonylcarbamoyladenosine biosynthesis protein TsaB